MWIITREGFVSLVQHDTDPERVRARARRREHLADTFDLNDADIIDLGPNAPDYRWHADVPKLNVAQAMYDAVMELDYTSHVKEEVARDDAVMYSAMLGCWRELYKLQDPPGHLDPDWWTKPEPAPTLDDLDDIVGQVGKLADKMRAVGAGDRPLADQEWPPTAHEPLTVEHRFEPGLGDCMICGTELHGTFVMIPEDREFGEPEGPATSSAPRMRAGR